MAFSGISYILRKSWPRHAHVVAKPISRDMSVRSCPSSQEGNSSYLYPGCWFNSRIEYIGLAKQELWLRGRVAIVKNTIVLHADFEISRWQECFSLHYSGCDSGWTACQGTNVILRVPRLAKCLRLVEIYYYRNQKVIGKTKVKQRYAGTIDRLRDPGHKRHIDKAINCLNTHGKLDIPWQRYSSVEWVEVWDGVAV